MKPDQGPAVTVVGAGIVGICCALSLLEKGMTVRLIDRDRPATGASQGNAGVISPWSCIPQSLPGLWRSVPKWLLDPKGPVALRWGYAPRVLPWVLRFLGAGRLDRVTRVARAMSALNRPNIELYRHHLKGSGQEGLLRDSLYVHLYRTAAEADPGALAWRLRRDHGASVELVGAEVLREVEPAVSRDYQAAILVAGQARAVSPGRLGQVLADKARTMGAEFLRAGVQRLVPAGGESWRLETDLGSLEAGKVVLAAGAWSARLLRPLGIAVPLEAERGYHLVFRDPGVALENSVIDMEYKFVASSMEAGLRSAGTAEFAGLDAAPDYRRARILSSLTKRMIPDLNTDDTNEWMGTRPSFPDSLPCIGAVPGHATLFAAFGHSHYGLGMAPRTGRAIADLVAGETGDLDLVPYRVDRFH